MPWWNPSQNNGGTDDTVMQQCGSCEGKGRIADEKTDSEGNSKRVVSTCSNCNGTGQTTGATRS